MKNRLEAPLVSLFFLPGSLRNPTELGVYRQGTEKRIHLAAQTKTRSHRLKAPFMTHTIMEHLTIHTVLLYHRVSPCAVTASLYSPGHIHVDILFDYVYLISLIVHSIHVDLFFYNPVHVVCVFKATGTLNFPFGINKSIYLSVILP